MEDGEHELNFLSPAFLEWNQSSRLFESSWPTNSACIFLTQHAAGLAVDSSMANAKAFEARAISLRLAA
jgi:hypothetical protein